MSPSFNQTKGAANKNTTTPQGETKPQYVCRATQRIPLYYRLIDGEPCFLDIEFQKYTVAGDAKQRHRIGRIAIVNSKGEVVLDVYAYYPKEDNIKKCYQPPEFGVVNQDLMFQNGAVAAAKVESWVADIVKGRTVVMHGGKHDLTAFYYEKEIWATSTIVDTQSFYGQVRLPTLAATVLNRTIQQGFHSPAEDADAMRELYLRVRPYNRAAALAAIRAAERAASATAQASYCNSQAQAYGGGKAVHNQVHGNLSGSAKRRARKQAAAAAQEAVGGGKAGTGTK